MSCIVQTKYKLIQVVVIWIQLWSMPLSICNLYYESKRSCDMDDSLPKNIELSHFWLNNIDFYCTAIQINGKRINSTTEQILIYAASMLCWLCLNILFECMSGINGLIRWACIKDGTYFRTNPIFFFPNSTYEAEYI